MRKINKKQCLAIYELFCGADYSTCTGGGAFTTTKRGYNDDEMMD